MHVGLTFFYDRGCDGLHRCCLFFSGSLKPPVVAGLWTILSTPILASFLFRPFLVITLVPRLAVAPICIRLHLSAAIIGGTPVIIAAPSPRIVAVIARIILFFLLLVRIRFVYCNEDGLAFPHTASGPCYGSAPPVSLGRCGGNAAEAPYGQLMMWAYLACYLRPGPPCAPVNDK